MFGIGKSKLLSEGASVNGVVTDCRLTAGIAGTTISDYHVTVRVKFVDGSSTEFKQKLSKDRVGSYFPIGTILPVRYDPDNHSKIEIDVPAVTPKEADYEAQDAAAIARAEAAIAQGTATVVGAGSAAATTNSASTGSGVPTDEEMATAYQASMAANTDRTAMDAFWAAKASGNAAEQARLKVAVAAQNAEAQALNKEFQRMSALRPDWHS
jgi:hypothetical protein